MKFIEKAIEKNKKRGYEFVYFCIDLHDTIITGTYKRDNKGSEFYPWGIEVLQSLSKNPKMKLILWTSSYKKPIDDFLKRVKNYSINFDYVNQNPECKNNRLCVFGSKFYFDILIDDKAGFNAKKDWGRIKKTLEKIGEW